MHIDNIERMEQFHAYSPEYHFRSIALLRERMLALKDEIDERLKETDYQAKFGHQANNYYEDDFIDSVYVDAAYSHMIAISLATLIESMFVHEFHNLSITPHYNNSKNNHFRWKLDSQFFWNPKIVATKNGKIAKRRNIVKGTIQLLSTLEIANTISTTKWDIVECLFEYRNCVVHGGLEWRKDTIVKFRNLLKSRNWNMFFEHSISGESIWIYYLKESVIENLFSIYQQIYAIFESEMENQLNN